MSSSGLNLDSGSALSTFASLLGSSLTPAEFFTTHWERAPLHVKRQAPEFYAGVFTKAAFDAHVRQRAATLQYGFDLNICVCSEDGKKIDMNPKPEKPTAKAPPAKVAPVKAVASSKKAAPAPAPPASKKSAKSLAANEGVQTMTIAEALKLAAQQKAKLGKKVEPEEEEEEEDEEDEDDEDDEEMGEDEEDGEDEDEDEEELDGTSVSTIKKYAPVTFSAYDRLYNSGCTVQALQPQQYTRSMWSLVSQLEDLFGGLVGANCYLTPPNSQGLAPHHDDVEVFVLQLEGTKSWKLYEPKMNLPREHSGDFARDELDEPFETIDLQPGDLMYLPRGVIHEARTSNDDSAHMTISVYQKTAWYDLLLTLFPRALESAFYSPDTDSFRKGLPVNFLSYTGTCGAEEDRIESTGSVGLPVTTGLDPANPTATRSALRAKMKETLHNVLNELMPIMESQIDQCADEMSQDFMTSRMPPPPPPMTKSKNPFAASSSSAADQRGPEPNATSKVRLAHPPSVRMIVVPAEDDEEDDDDGDEDEEDDSNTGGHLLLSHTLNNSASHHLDGRYPPDPALIDAAKIQLPLYFVPALMQLLRGGKTYRSIDSLQLELDGMLNGDGETPSAEEQQEVKLELVRTLWEAELLQVQEKQTTPPAAVTKQKKRPAEGATAEATQNNAQSKKQKKRAQ